MLEHGSVAPNRITISAIADIPLPTTDDIVALEAVLSAMVDEAGYAIGHPTPKTASNLLRAARMYAPQATPQAVAEFIQGKLRTGSSRFRGWGGVYTAVTQDYGSWQKRPATQQAGIGVETNRQADVKKLQEHLHFLREHIPRYFEGWEHPSDATALNILNNGQRIGVTVEGIVQLISEATLERVVGRTPRVGWSR